MMVHSCNLSTGEVEQKDQGYRDSLGHIQVHGQPRLQEILCKLKKNELIEDLNYHLFSEFSGSCLITLLINFTLTLNFRL